MMTATTVRLSLPPSGPPTEAVLRLSRPHPSSSGGAGSALQVVVLTRSDVAAAAAAASDDGAAASSGCPGAGRPRFVRSTDGTDGVYVRARAPVRLLPGGGDAKEGEEVVGPRSVVPLGDASVKLSSPRLLSTILPTVLLLAMSYAWLAAPTCGSDAVFPSEATAGLVLKVTVWTSLLITVSYEHWWFWTTGPSRWVGGGGTIEVDVTVLGWADGGSVVPSSRSAAAAAPKGGYGALDGAPGEQQQQHRPGRRDGSSAEVVRHVRLPPSSIDGPDPDYVTTVTLPSPSTRAGIELTQVRIGQTPDNEITVPAVRSVSADGEAFKSGVRPGMVLLGVPDRESVRDRIRAGPYPVVLEFYDLDGAVGGGDGSEARRPRRREARGAAVEEEGAPGAPGGEKQAGDAVPATSGDIAMTAPPEETKEKGADASSARAAAPPAQELPPFRFIAAEKGNIESARRRYAETLKWRAEMGMETIISEPHQNFAVIKKNWPHYYHLRGRNGEPCYYERPPDMNLKALRAAGITMDDLLRHYALTCEFMWTHIEPSEEGKSIYVIDLNGMGMRDFAGETVDFVKKTSAFTAAHYPERSGSIFVVNVPSWFSIIWKTVKPWVDPVTQKKIRILGYGDEAITKALEERIPLENIPPEYGGLSMPLGQSPEEAMFREKMEKNNRLALRPDAVETAEHEHME